MKLIAFVALAAFVATATATLHLDAPAIDAEMVKRVNAGNHGWTAGFNERFDGMTIRDVRAMLGALPSATHLPRNSLTAPNAVPAFNGEEFDARQQWPECEGLIGGILDQGRCGSCWAFAASELLADRHCISTGGAFNEDLSAQDMVSCDTGNFGCQGGYLMVSMNYLVSNGVVTEKCFPYTSGQSGDVEACPTSCTGEGDWVKYHGSDARDISGVTNMINDLTTYGSFEVGFTVYSDFMSYTGGVYSHTSTDVLGGHAVKIVGFGTHEGQEYWMVANSWGSSWGLDGFFMILKGANECGLESQAVSVSANTNTGLPAAFHLFNTLRK